MTIQRQLLRNFQSKYSIKSKKILIWERTKPHVSKHLKTLVKQHIKMKNAAHLNFNATTLQASNIWASQCGEDRQPQKLEKSFHTHKSHTKFVPIYLGLSHLNIRNNCWFPFQALFNLEIHFSDFQNPSHDDFIFSFQTENCVPFAMESSQGCLWSMSPMLYFAAYDWWKTCLCEQISQFWLRDLKCQISTDDLLHFLFACTITLCEFTTIFVGRVNSG
jgi:hypothetical protein